MAEERTKEQPAGTSASKERDDSVIEQSAQTVGDLVESGATLLGATDAGARHGDYERANDGHHVAGAAGKTAESAARTTMTAARSAGRATQRAARSTASAASRTAGRAMRAAKRAAGTSKRAAKITPKRTPKRAVKRAAPKASTQKGRRKVSQSKSMPSRRRGAKTVVAASERDPHLIVRWRTGCTVTGMDSVHGKGGVKCGPRDLGRIQYEVEVGVGRSRQPCEVRASAQRRGW